MKTGRLLIPFAVGLGLALALVWLLGGGTAPALSEAEGPECRPLQGDVITVCLSGGCDYTSVQAAVDAAKDGDVIKVATGIYTGVSARAGVVQVVYISKSVTIQGGYTTTNGFAGPPDPEANPTTLDAEEQGRVFYITGDISTTIEGLRVTGGDATGLGGGPWGYDAGGGVYVISATATISNTRVTNNICTGLYLIYGDITFSGDTVSSNDVGLWLKESTIALTNNNVSSNTVYGLYLDESVATLSDNSISSNSSYGLVLDESTATLDGNDISSNGGTGLMGRGVFTLTSNIISGNRVGGMWLDYSVATISGNTFISNTNPSFRGGALGVTHSDVTISGNTVTHNTAEESGGLYLDRCDATIIGNTISGNTATDYGGYGGGGLGLLGLGEYTLIGNTITSNTAPYGGGVRGGGVFTDNIVSANTAYLYGGGLLIDGNTILNGNIIISNTARYGGGVLGGGVFADNIISANAAEWGGGLYLDGSDVMLVNNIIADNEASTAGSGLYIGPFVAAKWLNTASSGLHTVARSCRLLHTTIARNRGGDGSGIYIGSGTVVLTNTVLVSHMVGITVAAGNTVTLEATLWGTDTWANIADWGGAGTIITGTPAYNYWGDPAFVDPETEDYHIRLGSAALDAGVDAGVTEDIDGDPRSDGHPDLGADELLWSVLLVTKQADPDPVQPGAQLTYTIRVTNTGNVTLTTTVTDTLPAHIIPGETSGGTLILPSGIITWTPVSIASKGIWTEMVVVTVEAGYAGPLTNVVQVTTEEGVSGVYTETSQAKGAPMLEVTKEAKPNVVQAGAQLTYTIRVTNTGDVNLHAIITDTLPVSVTLGATSGGTLILPGGAVGITWTAVITASGSVWTETVVVTLEVGYEGPLTNVVQVTTEEGAMGTYTETSMLIGGHSIYLPLVLRAWTPKFRGLVPDAFLVEGAPGPFGVGADIWFNMYITNGSDEPVEFVALGAWVEETGQFQKSWTYSEFQPGRHFSWRDHINIPFPGTYNLWLVICFTDDECVRLMGPVLITVQ